MGSTTPPTEDTAYRIKHPLEETEAPVINPCVPNQEVQVIPYNGDLPKTQKVDIISRTTQCAYYIIPSKPGKSLNHHAPGWGFVYFAIVLFQVSEGLYQEPEPDNVQYVAVKKLSKEAVHKSLKQGKKENPYLEILRMQTLGDNEHVLGCTEALEDDTHLYIIMPYCNESLVDVIPWQSGSGLEEKQALFYFRQILKNIAYLRSKGICHRDLSPDNCLLYNGKVLLNDLAMSFRVPSEAELVAASSTFGKPAYLPPEVFLQYPYNAYGCDLWSASVILFNLLTGEILYEMPHYNNLAFKYFILARGISSNTLNEQLMEILMELDNREHMALCRVAQVVMALNPTCMSLLDGVLRVAPRERWTVDQVERFVKEYM